MINTIVLDIGNVLAHFRWEEYIKECGYEEDVIRKISNATVLSKLWLEWDRGVREKAELIELYCMQEPSVEKEIRAFFDNILTFVKEYDYSAEFVQRLKANGYRVYLLSNYARWHFEYDKENFKFMKYVDGGIISYEIQYVKPEAEIYRELIRKYDINPMEAVFLDDLQVNLDGAKPFGFQTIQFKSFEQGIEELRLLGVRV